MTYNQLVYAQNKETERHNVAYETETAAHDRKMENVEEERNRIDDHFKRESLRIQQDMNDINRLRVEYENERDWARIMGRNPNIRDKVAMAAPSVKTHKHVFLDDTYTGDWKQAIIEYVDYLNEENAKLQEQYNREIANWTSGNSELFLEGQKLVSNYYTTSMDLHTRQVEALTKFAATWSAVSLNAEQEKTLKEQKSMYQKQKDMYDAQAKYYTEQANYQAWYNTVAPWQSVWGLTNQSLSSSGTFLKGVGSLIFPAININKGGKAPSPAEGWRQVFEPAPDLIYKPKYK